MCCCLFLAGPLYRIDTSLSALVSDKEIHRLPNWPLQSGGCIREISCSVLVQFGPGRVAALERWLPHTVTTIDRFCCTGFIVAMHSWCGKHVYHRFAVNGEDQKLIP